MLACSTTAAVSESRASFNSADKTKSRTWIISPKVFMALSYGILVVRTLIIAPSPLLDPSSDPNSTLKGLPGINILFFRFLFFD